MANVPVPRSISQILGGMLASFSSRHGIPGLKVGGPILSLFEAAAQSDLRSTQDIFTALDSQDLDSAEGIALDAWGLKEDVPRQKLTNATGTVNLGDASFTKVVSSISTAVAAPIAGSTSVNVADASLFPSTGAVYLGRGTSRYEGPIGYTSKVNNGTYWTLVLSSPTIRFHNQGETVILSRGGDRVVEANSTARVPRSSLADAVDFRTLFRATIPDGETVLSGVAVAAALPGSVGNAPAGAIREWAAAPFVGATVTNPLRFNNGFDLEDDDTYRERIRRARATRIKGVRTALEAAAVGVISPDEGRRVLSASYVARNDVPSLLVVDDGTGYEERSQGVSVERLLESASGGEQDLALQNIPVTKAFARVGTSPPYALQQGAQLAVTVGGVRTVHSFDPESFNDIGAATAYEIVSSINGDATLDWSARTVDGGSGLVVYAREETDDDIQVTAPDSGIDANDVLAFPSGTVRTVLLYRNDRPLSKDGRPARLFSLPSGSWSALVGSQTIMLSVDGTPTVTYTFTDQDFVNAGTGFLALGRNTPAAWAAVFRYRLPGVDAQTDGTRVVLSSNRGSSGKASLSITGGTLVAARMFQTGSATGVSKDFTLDRSLGLIRLTDAALPGDDYSAGSTSSRAFLESTEIAPVTLGSDAHLWVTPDGMGSLVSHGVTASTPMALLEHGVHDWGARLRLEAFPSATPTSSVFSNAMAGDWAILWDAAFPASARGAWRITEVGTVTVSSVTYATRLILERRSARSPRAGHAAVALVPVGSNASRTLVCGGWVSPSSAPGTPVAVSDTVEIYDHTAQTWTAAAPMLTPRAYHTAVTLADGRVLVVGGIDQNGNALASVETYDPTLDAWTARVAFPAATAYHQAVKLLTGKVLVCGGVSGSTYRTTASVYDPGSDVWSANLPMTTARARFGAALLADGRVLVAGGETTGGTSLTACELFNPAIPTWAAAAAMPSARKSFGLSGVGAPVTTVIAVGDDRAGANPGTYAVYTVGSNTWGSDTAITGGALFENKKLVTLQNGSVLALFGRIGSSRWSAIWNGATWATIANPAYADSASRDEVAVVLLYNNAATLLNRVVTVGGIDPTRIQPTAAAEVYDRTGDAWTLPDAAVASSLTLSQLGLSIARTSRWMQDLTVPAATGYTATSFASALAALRGGTAETHHTSLLRLRTNSYGSGGSIMLAAIDSTGPELTAGVQTNDVTSTAAVESASGVGTPDFTLARILEEGKATGAGVASVVRVNRTGLTGGTTLVVARDHDDGLPAAPHQRFGRNQGFRATSASVTAEPQATRLTLRATPDGGLAPYDRIWSAAPFAIGPSDTLLVKVDDSSASTFTIPMFRRTTPVGNVYGSQITLQDADNGGVTLTTAFGLAFDFDDFAVYMKARGALYSADNARSMLARYYLHGPAGNRARVRVSYPLAANAQAAINVDAVSGTNVDVRLRLPGGSPRNLSSIRSSTKLGVACTSVSGGLGTVLYVANLAVASGSRDGSNNSVLTLTLPGGVVDHGINVGDILYLNSSSPSWTSGNVSITARSATTVTFNNPSLGTGVAADTNFGTVSADPQGEATFSGAGIVADDFVQVSSASGLPASFSGETFRVTGATTGAITAIAAEKTFGATATTIAWYPLTTASYLSVWANNAPTATAFAGSINTLASAASSTCPVTLAVLGTGAGNLTRATVEDAGDSTAWISLSDGLNYVGRTVYPTLLTDQYQFILKQAVSSSLATGTAWASEDVRLVPTTPETVVRWLLNPAVSGLFTAGEVSLTQDGEKVQIASLTAGSAGAVQIQGGTANAGPAIVVGSAVDVGSETSVQVRATDAAGMQAGTWVEARNSIAAQRLGIFTGSTVLSSWDSAGYMTFSSTTLWTQRFLNQSVRLHVERQGRYVAISDPAGANANGAVTLAGLQEGDYVLLSAASTPTSFAQASAPNLGLYRVVRVVTAGETAGAGGAVWIENALAVEETAEFNILGIAYDSVLPGDKILISHDTWGHSNRGTWTVEAVGVTAGTVAPQFANTSVLKVSVSDRSPGVITGAALGTDSILTSVSEGVPGKMIKQIATISPEPTDGTILNVRLDSNKLSRLISAGKGTVLYPADKLGFATAAAHGTDGYQVSVGLVGEVSRVIHGDPADEITYPSVAAAGTKVLVTGSVVHRLKVSLLVRAVSGFNLDQLSSQVKETVASVINGGRVGQPIALSSIEREVSRVQGVVSVTIISPVHDSSHDVIQVAGDEKPLILSLDDVSVAFVAD